MTLSTTVQNSARIVHYSSLFPFYFPTVSSLVFYDFQLFLIIPQLFHTILIILGFHSCVCNDIKFWIDHHPNG